MPPISNYEDVNSGASSVYGQHKPSPNMGQELAHRLSHAAATRQVVESKGVADEANGAPEGGDVPADVDYTTGFPPESALSNLSDESRKCLQCLAAHEPQPEQE